MLILMLQMLIGISLMLTHLSLLLICWASGRVPFGLLKKCVPPFAGLRRILHNFVWKGFSLIP